MFGRGIYLTDSFSKAAVVSFSQQQANQPGSHYGVVLLAEAALGEMHRAFEPDQFANGLPIYCHSVYGVGQQKPAISGLVDVTKSDMKLDLQNINSTSSIYFNTGELKSNPELQDLPVGTGVPDLKLNDFVCYDQAQVRLRYAVFCEYHS